MNSPVEKPPYLTKEELREEADEFLDTYWPSREIPVDVDHIVDVEFGIDVIPVPGLQTRFSIDGFLASGADEIRVDEYVYQNVLVRYRFTLAHELSHLWLHEDLIEVLAEAEDIDEWREIQDAIPGHIYRRFEQQAYILAGLILVPHNHLPEVVDSAKEKARRELPFDIDLANTTHRDRLAVWVGNRFDVSDEVILRRGDFAGLWDFNPHG